MLSSADEPRAGPLRGLCSLLSNLRSNERHGLPPFLGNQYALGEPWVK
jgi:hypothetical protein